MRALIAIALLCVATLGGAQDWAKAKLDKSPRHQEWVTVKNGSRDVKTFVVYPEVKEKAPVVVLIHEIFGLTTWVQSVADDLAAAGYIAVAPDLLSGAGPGGGRTDSFPDAQKAIEAISGLPPDQVTADLNAVCDYALGIPAGNGKISLAGFCWGGTQSFRFATNRRDLQFSLVFYGTAPESGLERIKAPVFGFYGGNDSRVSSTIPETAKKMAELGKKYMANTYDGAGHGFMRAGEAPDATDANQAARKTAWDIWLALLKKLK